MIPPGRHGEHLAELVRCRREREAAQAAVERVRALHSWLVFTSFASGPVCSQCKQPDPCDTIQALDPPPETPTCHGDLRPQQICAECGAYNAEEG